MSLPEFIASLLAEGRTSVPSPEEITANDRYQTSEILADFEQTWRSTLPGDPPALQSQAALWASAQFYRACQYSLFRDEGPDFDFEPLDGDSELGQRPETHYSVDLTFRFLPDLVKQVRAAASKDPLGDKLHAWSRDWPLSSVGVAGVESEYVHAAPTPVVGHPSLLRLYVDRIIECRDVSRLDNATVRQAVAAAIGVHDDLAPQLAAALRTHDQVSL